MRNRTFGFYILSSSDAGLSTMLCRVMFSFLSHCLLITLVQFTGLCDCLYFQGFEEVNMQYLKQHLFFTSSVAEIPNSAVFKAAG